MEGELRLPARALEIASELIVAATRRSTPGRLHRLLMERVAVELGADEGALVVADTDAATVAARFAGSGPPTSDAAVLARWAGRGVARLSDHELHGPITFDDQELAWLWLRRVPPSPPFSEVDRALLRFLVNRAGLILENSRLLEHSLDQQRAIFHLRGLLEQYLSPAVAERLISGATRPLLQGQRLTLTAVIGDMRRSSELMNRIGPEAMVHLLNQYFSRLTDVVFRYEGTVDKFAGDAVLGFFGAPARHEDDPRRAVRAAVAMQRVFADLRLDWGQDHPLPESLGIGIAVTTGEVVVGNIGSGKRLDHTIIGAPVNLAARLAKRAPAGAIYLDEATWQAVAEPLGLLQRERQLRPRLLRLEGFGAPVAVYRLRLPDLSGS